MFLKFCQVLGLLLGGLAAQASQFGPMLPTHRFPTDESYHLGYSLVYGSSSSNFVGVRSTEDLNNSSSFRLIRQLITVEYQPSRRLSFGAFLVLDSVSLSSALVDTESVSSTKLGDQRAFLEYRFSDGPGYSMGAAVMFKFPFYKNPDTIADDEGEIVALLGDAQTDMSVFLTGEFWLSDLLRLRSDLGYTYRTEHFSAEIPFLLSLGLVSPSFDFELKFLGNFSRKNDSFSDTESDIRAFQAAFANSNYAYAEAPWVLAIEPEFSYWFTPKWAAQGNMRYSLLGGNSPNFYTMSAGVTYRWGRTDKRVRRTIKELDIDVDQEAGLFPGETKTN